MTPRTVGSLLRLSVSRVTMNAHRVVYLDGLWPDGCDTREHGTNWRLCRPGDHHRYTDEGVQQQRQPAPVLSLLSGARAATVRSLAARGLGRARAKRRSGFNA